MERVKGRTAVITGAASGIGAGLAQSFSQAGINLLLSDVEEAALEKTTEQLKKNSGAHIVSHVADVSEASQVESLAEFAFSEFGTVNILCNNAGVIENNKPAWEYDMNDWEWVLNVNLMGVVHGVKSFVPKMLRQEEPSHIVNTASIGGLVTGSATPIYVVSKHAVVALSECLCNSFERETADISVSVLCPGWVDTNIADSDRNRKNNPVLDDSGKRSREKFKAGVKSGISPNEVGKMVLSAILEKRFYIMTHPEWSVHIEERFKAIAKGHKAARTLLPRG